ncbi:MBL fold metallo-hydrolase [Halopseudomonas salina]|uniref:MBL fold hydrolase n=1 Tax=Halopseudomonas salina TaxID=1323744 RepID=A0ABQ1P5B6_9GAMM|nr:MBL fold metallo-hydrolase [Halopseudomonas salina]GGC89217.1 MBL fold hydrolase [Halopseudomonas salina]
MIIETIKTEGLSQLSYLVGSNGAAVVIDPQRDCDTYIQRARARGMQITHIFETHRNEDFISGAPVLAELTGAKVWHGPNPAAPVRYAETTREGDSFDIGAARICVLETPGHTDDHLAFALFDSEFDQGAVGVFTGDALFVGDVGRTDFYPDRAREVSGLLFDSLRKLEKLGDQTIIYPAHGAGSVCGAGMADREFSTIGHERTNNPSMKITDRDEFIATKVAENHYLPPYFSTMERLNVEGGSAMPHIAMPVPLDLAGLKKAGADYVIDTRSVAAFAGAHWPGALCIPAGMITAFAGWFLQETDRIALVSESMDEACVAATHLRRTGFDHIVGAFTNMVGSVANGQDFASMSLVDVACVKARMTEQSGDWTLLDVRAADEVDAYPIEAARHIYVGHLNKHWRDLDPTRAYTVMCASGARASVAAGWLKTQGFDRVDVFLGSVGAWKADAD